jgi:Tryptophan-associated transmembrane protein (Trp_oprn_chp)
MPDDRLRVIGFVVTAAGALAAGAGTAATWVTVGFRSDLQGVLSEDFRGLDLSEGMVALALAGIVLVSLVVLRRVQGISRIRVATGILLAGVVLIALPTWVALRADERAIDELARAAAAAGGLTVREAEDLIRGDPELAVVAETGGAWLSIAGGVLVAAGGAVNIAWARREHATPER